MQNVLSLRITYLLHAFLVQHSQQDQKVYEDIQLGEYYGLPCFRTARPILRYILCLHWLSNIEKTSMEEGERAGKGERERERGREGEGERLTIQTSSR